MAGFTGLFPDQRGTVRAETLCTGKLSVAWLRVAIWVAGIWSMPFCGRCSAAIAIMFYFDAGHHAGPSALGRAISWWVGVALLDSCISKKRAHAATLGVRSLATIG